MNAVFDYNDAGHSDLRPSLNLKQTELIYFNFF